MNSLVELSTNEKELNEIMATEKGEDKTQELLYFIAKQLIEIKYLMK